MTTRSLSWKKNFTSLPETMSTHLFLSLRKSIIGTRRVFINKLDEQGKLVRNNAKAPLSLFLSHSLSFSVQLGSFLSLKAARSSTTTTSNLPLSHRERYCVWDQFSVYGFLFSSTIPSIYSWYLIYFIPLSLSYIFFFF